MCISNKWKGQNPHGIYPPVLCTFLFAALVWGMKKLLCVESKAVIRKRWSKLYSSSKYRFNREPVSRLPFKCTRGHDPTEIYDWQTAKYVYHVASGKLTLAVVTQQVHTKAGWDRSMFIVYPLAGRRLQLNSADTNGEVCLTRGCKHVGISSYNWGHTQTDTQCLTSSPGLLNPWTWNR